MMQIAQPALVGTSLPRQDGPDKVTGRARYAGDQTLPGMLYARLVTSPYAHALILNIDTSAALSVPGVVAVFTSEMLGMAEADALSVGDAEGVPDDGLQAIAAASMRLQTTTAVGLV